MFCPYCGKENADGSRFCKHCGSQMPQQQATGQQNRARQPQPQPQQPRQQQAPPQMGQQPMNQEPPKKGGALKVVIGILIGLLILGLIGGGVFAFLRFSSDDSSSEKKSKSRTETTSEEEPEAVKVDVSELKGFDEIASFAGENEQGELTFVSSDVSEYPTVKVYYHYEDTAGESITLESPTAAVKETISGGSEIERTIRSIEQIDGNQGLSIDIVADKSGSMSSDLATMQEIMTEFVDHLDYDSGDKAELISFDSYIMYMCTYTDDAALLRNGVSNMTAYGDTALYDALYTGVTNAGSRAGARVVIGFTDGEDNVSTHTMQEVITLAQTKEVPVYLIGTSAANTSDLTNICTSTGGMYWTIDDISDMSDIMDQIYSRQKDVYCITYESDSDADAYASRTISCVVADENYGGELDDVSFTPVETLVETEHASRYEFVKGDVCWTEANNAAIAKGGHLVTITSQEEQDIVSNLADEAGIKYVWIGGYTSVREGLTFGHWVTGEAFSFADWYPGEPSRNDTDGTPEFYLMQWKINDEWSWNDQRDDVVNSGLTYFKGNVGYVIEYED